MAPRSREDRLEANVLKRKLARQRAQRVVESALLAYPEFAQPTGRRRGTSLEINTSKIRLQIGGLGTKIITIRYRYLSDLNRLHSHSFLLSDLNIYLATDFHSPLVCVSQTVSMAEFLNEINYQTSR